jgi:transposase-like protein
MPTARNPTLSARWTTAPDEVAAEVLRALDGKTVGEAAEALGVGERTLWRWIREKPQLIGALDVAPRPKRKVAANE